jgi:hypothetical protein
MKWPNQLFSRRRRYDELSESIREHLDEKIADLIPTTTLRMLPKRRRAARILSGVRRGLVCSGLRVLTGGSGARRRDVRVPVQ